jgi:hypothetical protein
VRELRSKCRISGEIVFGQLCGLLRGYDVPATFGAGVVSLKLVKDLAMSRTIKHMNPPAAAPHITGADT